MKLINWHMPGRREQTDKKRGSARSLLPHVSLCFRSISDFYPTGWKPDRIQVFQSHRAIPKIYTDSVSHSDELLSFSLLAMLYFIFFRCRDYILWCIQFMIW